MSYTFLILAVSAQIFDPIAELIIPIRIPSKDAKAVTEIHPLTTEAILRKYPI